ncbi:N-acetylornithine carbamoyltransferase [Salinibacter altiplanensis]|uniref:N-acetylornithine carbamoyltransferase n=1 Tax=Salinibacter altiplanensis TaxID=1803181 RepID=UPI000C9F83D3|nr:N-acetylornithine carbamoyltransferase [Salinibacter altiplanensis]
MPTSTPTPPSPSPPSDTPPDLRHVLQIDDFSDATWDALRHAAVAHRHDETRGADTAAGTSLGLVFLNPSLRTRTSMEGAAAHLGAHYTTLVPGDGSWDLEWEEGAVMDGDAPEHVKEAISVLSRYHDALGVRVFASGIDYAADARDTLIRTIAEVASVPVVNLESAWAHPCQGLSDAALLTERFGDDLTDRKFVLSWAPHPKPLPMAVPNTALRTAARCGMDVTVARPDSHALDPDLMAEAQSVADTQGGSVATTSHQAAAVDDADVVYAKSWGGPLMYTDPEGESEARAAQSDWGISEALMARTDDAAFLHCLPVRRNVVVDDAVLDGPHAAHLDQAEYRLHAQKALLEYVWGL